jgi:hypothetical protein
MATLVTEWSDVLTQAQRDAWEVYATNVPKTGPLGDQINVSGQNMYLRGNVSRQVSGLPIADDAPTLFNLGTFTEPTLAIDTANDEVDVTFENTDGWANEDDSAMQIYASRPQNAGIAFFKGPYRLAGNIDGDGTTPPTSPAAITLPFPVVAGQKIFFRVIVTRADGRLSTTFRSVATAA